MSGRSDDRYLGQKGSEADNVENHPLAGIPNVSTCIGSVLAEIDIFRSANVPTRVQRLSRTFPGQLSGLRDPPLDLRTAGNIAKHLSQLLGPRAGEGSVGLDPGLVQSVLSNDADAADDGEVGGFVLSRRFLGRLFLRLLPGYTAESAAPKTAQHACKGQHVFHSRPTDILLSLERRACLVGLSPAAT